MRAILPGRAYPYQAVDDVPTHEWALSVSAIADVSQRRLGTSKAHRLRRTFARRMIEQGATITDAPCCLGPSGAATTAISVEAQRSGENPYAEELVKELGVVG